jgi:hypothetical protein
MPHPFFFITSPNRKVSKKKLDIYIPRSSLWLAQIESNVSYTSQRQYSQLAQIFRRWPVHPAYNPSFLTCFFSRNSVFLSQQIIQRCFSAGLSAQPNGADGRFQDFGGKQLCFVPFLFITQVLGFYICSKIS